MTAGETCDDGNSNNTDGCRNECLPNICGDGYIHGGVEACDDGNSTNGDGCDVNCTPTGCGNGVVSGGEICDDGNALDGDGCDSNCKPSACGNGMLTRGQKCDPGVSGSCVDICNDAWAHPFGSGLDATARAVVVNGADVYVGGDFNSTQDHSIGNQIAKWKDGVWSALGSGTDAAVYGLAMIGNDLYAGGEFGHAGGVAAASIAKWNGTTWSALGAGTDNIVLSLFASGTDLYVGGRFDTAGGITANNIAKWDGNQWSALGEGVDSDVNAFAKIGTDLYVGGLFEYAGGVAARGVAKWDGSHWSALGAGTPSDVYTLAVLGSDLYAAGEGFVMKWDGSSWSTIADLPDYQVYASTVMGGNLYFGGTFRHQGARNIAKWDGSQWSALGSGVGDEGVFALTSDGTGLIAVGGFGTAGGSPNAWIASWHDTACGEQCDDGNATSGDGCDSNCKPTACGNGVVSAGETCDDGNLVDGDGCDSDCTSGCGNGIATAGETCDDGNASNGDGCEADCSLTPITQLVDPGDTVSSPPASPEFPVQTAITTPNGGTITIAPPSQPSTQEGFSVVGTQLEITAPDASTTSPLKIVMTVDASAIPPGFDASRLDVTRNGVEIVDCTGPEGEASPDPCIDDRTVVGGNVEITVLTVHASLWSVVVRGLFKGEQKCINGVTGAGVGVSKAQAKANATCLKAAAVGEADAELCLAADAKGKVGGRMGKTAKAAVACVPPPPFGFTATSTINVAAQEAQLRLMSALFGNSLNSAIAADKAGAACQASVLKAAQTLLATKAKLFLGCQKSGLAGKTSLIVSKSQLRTCFDSLTADVAGKIAKGVEKLGGVISSKCSGNLATLLPGSCGTSAEIARCLDTRVECRLCRMFNAMAGLSADCDKFDDGQANSSCP